MADAAELDEHFGVCRPGDRREAELNAREIECHDLDEVTADYLNSLLYQADANPFLHRLMTNCTLLWAVTKTGPYASALSKVIMLMRLILDFRELGMLRMP
jgi:hypothetical protein